MANPSLESEQSDQYSLGFIFSPMDWLNLSLDYYNIKVENNISQVSAQTMINKDLYPEIYGSIPEGLSIDRNPATGAIREIRTSYRNIGDLETDGLDLRFDTNFSLGNAGALRNMLTISYVNKYEVTDAGLQTIDYAGYLGTPDTRATLANVWSFGDFDVSWNVNYIKGQKNPDTTNDDGELEIGSSVGGYATNDVQFTWNAPWNGKIAIGATNLGNRYPELVDYDGRPWNFYLYDAYGRTTYLRYTQTF